jgi:putative oxidoreductase
MPETLERELLATAPRTPTFDVTGWVLRISAAILFLGVGLSKFESDSQWVGLFAAIGLGDWFRYLTGALQAVGGALFLLPKTVPVAAAVAGSTMLGAVAAHLFVLGTGIGGAVIPAIVLAFVVWVALRRAEA